MPLSCCWQLAPEAHFAVAKLALGSASCHVLNRLMVTTVVQIARFIERLADFLTLARTEAICVAIGAQ